LLRVGPIVLDRKPANASVPIHELLARRCSTHAFDREGRVSMADQLALLEAARWAPSWTNREPCRLIVCDRFERPEAWQRLLDALDARERPWAYNAALLILVAADLTGIEPELRARALFDTGAASLQLCLEASARNLGTHTTSGFDEARLRSPMGIPEHAAGIAIVCVGQRADLGTLGRDVYRREVAPRTRSTLSSHCFDAHWGRPFREPSRSSEITSPSDSVARSSSE
jgi:nitroreductase